MEKLKVSLDNQESRMLFVDYWAHFCRTHSDDEWGEQQKRFINAGVQSARCSPLSPRQYLKIKGEPCSR